MSTARYSSLVLFVLVLAFTTTVYSAYTTISTGAQLKAFANEVNAGTTYSGSTVTLANDIDMNGVTDFPIIGFYGKATDFRGVFDGKGYRIKNLNITTSSIRYAGLFGYSWSCTIKNVVIDSSCSVTNSESTCGYAAGIITYADTGGSETKIQNCVNMGAITGKGPKSKVGGIAGLLYGNNPAKIENCVNIGKIEYAGAAEKAYVGGIVGWIAGAEGKVPSVYNCVNLGEIKLTTKPTEVGGIVGSCTMSTGIIQKNYWLSGTASKGYTGGTASGNEAFGSDYKLSSGASLVNTLNNYASSSGLQKWGTVTFNMNGGNPVSSRMTMWFMLGAPDTPTKTGHDFKGWFTDTRFNNALDMNKRYGSGGGASLYAKWSVNNYTLIFDFDNGTVDEKTFYFNETIDYPENPTKLGYTFDGWDINPAFMPAEDTTIKAMWTPNNYTVTFNTNWGSLLSNL